MIGIYIRGAHWYHKKEQDLKEYIFKIKVKIMNSKNILNNSTKSGSEILSHRDSKSLNHQLVKISLKAVYHLKKPMDLLLT